MSNEGRIKARQKFNQVEIKMEGCGGQRLWYFFKTYKSCTVIKKIAGPEYKRSRTFTSCCATEEGAHKDMSAIFIIGTRQISPQRETRCKVFGNTLLHISLLYF